MYIPWTRAHLFYPCRTYVFDSMSENLLRKPIMRLEKYFSIHWNSFISNLKKKNIPLRTDEYCFIKRMMNIMKAEFEVYYLFHGLVTSSIRCFVCAVRAKSVNLHYLDCEVAHVCPNETNHALF